LRGLTAGEFASRLGKSDWRPKFRHQIALRAVPDELVFKAAPPGIKFALGENVKQSNWGDQNTHTFSSDPHGVRTLIDNRFTAAKEYLAAWDKYKKSGGVPPAARPELETIGESACASKARSSFASYRQDEILTLIRLMESFASRLEPSSMCSKATKLPTRSPGTGRGSAFADWWAYKFEVYACDSYNEASCTTEGRRIFSIPILRARPHLYLERPRPSNSVKPQK